VSYWLTLPYHVLLAQSAAPFEFSYYKISYYFGTCLSKRHKTTYTTSANLPYSVGIINIATGPSVFYIRPVHDVNAVNYTVTARGFDLIAAHKMNCTMTVVVNGGDTFTINSGGPSAQFFCHGGAF
jgi:hypothetical protein